MKILKILIISCFLTNCNLNPFLNKKYHKENSINGEFEKIKYICLKESQEENNSLLFNKTLFESCIKSYGFKEIK